MHLDFLGAGSAFSRKYGTTCSLVTLPSKRRWLLDCGRQAPDQLFAAGLGWHQIDGQIITHHHGDHSYGLEDFAFNRYYEGHGAVDSVMRGGPRPKFIAHSAVEAEVWAHLYPSLRYLRLGDRNTDNGTLEHYFEVLKAKTFEPPGENSWRHSERFETDGLALIARECEHVPHKPSCSIEFEVPGAGLGKIAWWSGDSVVDVELLVRLESRTTVFFHDCTFTDYPGQVHGAFHLLAQLPENIRRKMVLMHHDDNIERRRREVEAAGFRLAFAGDRYDLQSGSKVARGSELTL